MALHFNETGGLSSIHRIRLSVDSGVLHEGIFAKQGDSSSRWLEITLLSDTGKIITPDEGAIPRLRCVKPDETLVISDGYVSGGRVFVELTEQMLTAPGRAYADIAVYDGDDVVLSTQLFQINITETPFDDETVESTSDFSALSNALLKAESALNAANTAVSRAEDAVERAEAVTPSQTDVLTPGNNISIEDGVISVVTTDMIEPENTMPVTSAAVYTAVGNINALLETI